MILESELVFVFTHVMPVILCATTAYVAFSAAACAASGLFPVFDGIFSSAKAKTLPFFLMAVFFATLRL
jgi:hypothetical protein